MPQPITILIVDDHEPLREGIKILLEFEEDLSLLGEATNGREAVEAAQRLRPDVVVMDITMPEMDGLEATRQIRERLPETQVLIVSAEDDNTGVEQAIGCGALGFICKHTSLMHVPHAIREIHAGNTFFALSPPQPSDDDGESEIEQVQS